jgi:hypothetical protein
MLEREARETGMKMGHLIETALRHHLAALDALPADVLVPARLAVTRKSWDELVKAIESPSAPTPAMRELMGVSAAAEPGKKYRAKSGRRTKKPGR